MPLDRFKARSSTSLDLWLPYIWTCAYKALKKLDPKPNKCIFIGYGQIESVKGYDYIIELQRKFL